MQIYTFKIVRFQIQLSLLPHMLSILVLQFWLFAILPCGFLLVYIS